MTDKPIIFSPAMVEALLAGRKTQTRRIQNGRNGFAAGDRLYVRERFSPLNESRPSKISEATHALMMDGHHQYRNGEAEPGLDHYAKGAFDHVKWAPSIHMPRWASRLTLNVTNVRVERLQDISEADAVAEGVAPFGSSGAYLTPKHRDGKMRPGISAYDLFRDLWNDINGPEAWAANPWVAVITFDVVKANIDHINL